MAMERATGCRSDSGRTGSHSRAHRVVASSAVQFCVRTHRDAEAPHSTLLLSGTVRHPQPHRSRASRRRHRSAYQVDQWTALGDPTRRAIFEALATRPRAVGELAGHLPVSRPAVSQHLKVLANAGLVVAERTGTRRIYRVDMDGVAALRTYLDQFWMRALVAYKAAVEQRNEEHQ